MLQIIDYKETETNIKVGFKKHNFVVYGEIGIFEGHTKEQHIQVLYEQCKNSIDYETERYNKGLSNSIITDLEGEKFIPEEPKLKTLKLLIDEPYIQFEEGQEEDVIYISTITKDQYSEDIEVEVALTTSLGNIEDNILTIPNIEEYTIITVTATSGDIVNSKEIQVSPYMEQKPNPLEESISNVIDRINILDSTSSDIAMELQSIGKNTENLEPRITDVEQIIDIMIGGEVIE